MEGLYSPANDNEYLNSDENYDNNIADAGEQQDLPDEDYLKVRLYFHSNNKANMSKLFTEEWFTIAAESMECEIDKADVPFLEFEILEYSKIGEMLTKALQTSNKIFEDCQIKNRFKEDITGGDVDYEIYAAKKTGLPRDDYPNFDIDQLVRNANVKNNYFSVVFADHTLIQAQQKRQQQLLELESNKRDPKQSYAFQPESEPGQVHQHDEDIPKFVSVKADQVEVNRQSAVTNNGNALSFIEKTNTPQNSRGPRAPEPGKACCACILF